MVGSEEDLLRFLSCKNPIVRDVIPMKIARTPKVIIGVNVVGTEEGLEGG